jgi:hypothetical protein
MTTPEKTQDDIPVSPLLGAILTASIEQVGETTDQLLESKDQEIAEWKSAFAKLYDAIDSANVSVDSMKIGRIVGAFSQKREWAEPDTNSH